MGMASFSNSAADRCAGAEGGGAGVFVGDCDAGLGAVAAEPDVSGEDEGTGAAAEFFGGWFVCCAPAAVIASSPSKQLRVSRIADICFISRYVAGAVS
jgi:hypothetical protein